MFGGKHELTQNLHMRRIK